jgi:hypothetical protein
LARGNQGKRSDGNEKGSGQTYHLPAAFWFVFPVCRVSGDGRELDDLRGRSELSILYTPPVQAMSRDADRMMQVVELFAVEPDGLLCTPAETLRPG